MATDGTTPPRLVAGRYRLERLLGRGGSGAVWRGHDERLDRPVAVKEITFPVDVDEAAIGRSRALREARAAARLAGAGVVGVYDIIESEGSVHLIMELVEAPNLATLIRRAGPLTPPTAAVLGLHVLDTLAAAHRAGIVHRDVKPSNVLIDDDGPRLADFGIARLGDDSTLTRTGVVMGTPAYIAPEHARGGDVGPPADLYGLGATLYYAVEGVAPFTAQGSMATILAVLNAEPRPPRRAGALGPVLLDLLVKDPAARPDADALRPRLRVVATSAADGRDVTEITTEELVRGAAIVAATTESEAGPADAADAAARAPVAPDRRAGTTADPRRRRVGIALVAAALLAAGGAWLVDRGDDGRSAPVAAAGATPSPTPGGAPSSREEPAEPVAAPSPAGPAARPSPVQPTDGRGGARDGDDLAPATPGAAPPVPPSTGSDGVLPALDDVEVPASWAVYDAPDAPYRVAHPPGWQPIKRSATITDLRDPETGTYLRLDWVGERRDPVRAWETVESGLRQRHDGYRRLRLVPTTFRGARAALWEYRYRDAGVALRAYNLGVNRGDVGFALNLQARQDRFDEARRLWPVFLASYRFQGQ